MSEMLAGKVAVVTGAGGGIGRGIALAMAAAGAKVVVNDIGASLSGDTTSAGPAQQVVDEITKAGGKAVPNTDSVATRASANNIIQTAIEQFGRIDIVVNNAGNLRDRVFHKMSDEEWSQVIDVHLNGTFYVSRAAANHFREQESGAFVHMTSTSGLIGNFGQANYSAAKLGIAALSKSIALDMSRYNVRSNCIAPFAWSRRPTHQKKRPVWSSCRKWKRARSPRWQSFWRAMPRRTSPRKSLACAPTRSCCSTSRVPCAQCT